MSNNFLIIALMIVVMYFLMIRPQAKRQKQEKNFIQSMKKGDKVITKGGIHSHIVKLEPNAAPITPPQNAPINKIIKLSITMSPYLLLFFV